MIFFTTLNIDQYKSIKKYELDFLTMSPITAIVGRFGSGKTSILESLIWCLYGVNLKDLKASSIKSKVFKSGTKVEVEFFIGVENYKVVRTHNYKAAKDVAKSGVTLFVNDKAVASDNTVEINKKIVEILGMDAKLFMATTMFPQRMAKISELASKDVKDILDSLLNTVVDTSFIEVASGRCENEISTLTEKLITFDSDKKLLESKIENTEEYIKRFKSEAKVYKDDKKGRAEQLELRLSEVSAKAEELKGKLLKVPEASSAEEIKIASDVLKSSVSEFERKITDLEKDIEDLEYESLNSKCSKCGAELKGVTPEVIENKKVELSALRVSLKSKHKEIKKLTDKIEKHNQVVIHNSNIKTELRIIDASLAEIRKQKQSELSYTNPYTAKKLKKLKKELKIREAKLQQITDKNEKNVQTLSQYKWWKSKAFGSNGLKIYLFNAVLEKLNNAALKYTQPFGLTAYVQMTGNVNKSLEINVMKDGDKLYNYKELSGGEKSQFDAALGLAMSDVVSDCGSNIIFFDEYFEGMDKYDSQDMIFDLLRIKAKKTKVILITHNNLDNYPDIDLIEVKKDNFITTIN